MANIHTTLLVCQQQYTDSRTNNLSVLKPHSISVQLLLAAHCTYTVYIRDVRHQLAQDQ